MNEIINQTIKGLKSRNIDAVYYDTLGETKQAILNDIDLDKTIGIGNSQTLKDMEISKALSDRGNIVYDKTMAHKKEAVRLLKKKSLLTDCYITSSNALSKEGHIVNIDHSGNRVAAMTYGPDKVIVVVGKNKITDSLESAIDRARNHAAPLNAKRAGKNPPCLETKTCVDCRTKERVCYTLAITEGQYEEGRMKVFIVGEDVGF